MTYRIEGLRRAEFAHLFAMNDAELSDHNALRMKATGPGFPCRITLTDAEPGESVILLNHLSHDAPTPYRSSYAIFVREASVDSPAYVDATPPVFEGRPIGLKGFSANGMLKNAALALPGQADEKIRALFEDSEIAYIHAHNAAHGCYSCTIERHDGQPE